MQIDQIISQYRFGMVARRWGALWVDGAILWMLPAIPVFTLGQDLYQKTIILWVACLFSYLFVMEGLLGWTLGKWLFGICVVNREGKRPGLLRAFIRTLIKVVEANPMLFSGLLAAIIVLLTKKRQRLGDMAAGTYVVRKKDVPRITPAQTQEADLSFAQVVRSIQEVDPVV